MKPSEETYTLIDEIKAHLAANDELGRLIRAVVYEEDARTRGVQVDAGLKVKK